MPRIERDNKLEQSGYKSTPAENMTLETVCCFREAKNRKCVLIIQKEIDRVAIFLKEIGDNFHFPLFIFIANSKLRDIGR